MARRQIHGRPRLPLPETSVNSSFDVRSEWPMLAAEFLVIVVGVLVALGVDSRASWRNDRQLETEYLERLLEDVRYDLGAR